MKKLFVLILSLLPVITLSQNISTIYSFRTYHSENTNYVEINNSIASFSLKCAAAPAGKYVKQAELTTIICFSDQPDSAVYVDKRILKTPEVADSNEISSVSMLDMQRVALTNGTYIVFFELRDVNTDNQPMYYKDVFKMDYNNDDISVSDIMVIDSYSKTSKENIYSKNGYDMHPYMYDGFDKKTSNINYYAEIYNADKTFGADSLYILNTIIEDIATGVKVKDIQKVKRQRAEKLTPYIGNIDISSLYEGTYYLTVEVRGADNILYAYSRYPFFKQSDKKYQLDNPEIPSDAFVNRIVDSLLKEHIYCLRPIASNQELDYILKETKKSTPAQDRYFLYQFYKKRNSITPESTWKDYMTQVSFVNQKYSTPIKKGYDTDMGRVLLMYGAPTNIIDEKFGASSGFDTRSLIDQRTNIDAPHMDPKGVHYYPYQIWVYDRTPYGESNRKFVFYAKQDNLYEYFLLHSNARGELQDPYWENVLSHGSLEQGVVGKAGRQFQKGHE